MKYISIKADEFEVSLERIASALSVDMETDFLRCKCLLLVGSQAEQLDTDSSDLDLMLVVDGHESSWGENEKFRSCLLNGMRTEVLILDDAGLKKLTTIHQSPSYSRFALRDLEFLHRLLNGRVLHGKEWHDIFLGARREIYQERMSEFYLKFAENFYEDTVGLSVQEDSWTQIIQSRELARLSFDALLAANGDTYPKKKWRGRRLMRCFSERRAVVDNFYAIEFDIPRPTKENCKIWCGALLSLAAQNQLEIYFGVRRDLLLTEIIALPGRIEGYIFRHLGKFYLHSGFSVFEIPEAVALCLLLLSAKFRPEDLPEKIEGVCFERNISPAGIGDAVNFVTALVARGIYFR
ncbi:hypothetical protein NU688_10080 [Variovorax sp. ZS18.2.2]|uniref:hypothetical protein n=1 Tax=Variovorax sp. ZS18.2.2 TaxID=2971255 RepID=UPI002151C591|nr:hypothetical protein [Variovorax sp. ZS18.2.2]MCR6476503.1 hypothetical protein [Variovorax sp. ZS18.2.2]